ncbi:hypothetical protein BH20CHL8_BH20CHL8_08050 [soil metagenome]
MPEPLLLLLGLGLAGALVLAPLWRDGARPPADEAHDAAALRHRVALEALRDVELDQRTGSLDDATYAAQLVEAEGRAAATRAGLEEVEPQEPRPERGGSRSRVIGSGIAAVVALALLVGATVPGTGLANQTVVNEQLAAARDAEADRQGQIETLLHRFGADPTDGEALSDLADAYLAGSTQDDLVRAAVALRLLIEIDPDRANAYERTVTAYLRAGDYPNARAALDSYSRLPAADPIEVAFFAGLIALRGEGDSEAAVEAFNRFLELAPGDGRAGMIRGLRDEAAQP